ncbi:MAG TPA: heavy-metal-associated domain-containing protein [Candidatus Norongarragalinales archaeon]|nr:heavy-metal-associated domain-containing protein [Candidatus Norongarragalinales archaeon]
MEKTFTAYNLTCDACKELIGRAVSKFPGSFLKSVDLKTGMVCVDCPEEDFEQVRESVYARGYGPGVKKSVHHVLRAVLGDDSAFNAERKILEYSIGSLLIVLGVQFLLSLMLFQNIAELRAVFAPLLFFLAVGITATIAAVAHLSFFRTELTGMTGMMVGMTVGMTSGFMLGAIIGATNGMFIGSLSGMAVGMALGAWAGRCCGIMGIMEGLMAGLMSGTMGAMLSVMMLREPLLPFLGILMASCIVILAGLSFAVFKEAGNIPQTAFKASFFEFAVASLLASIPLTLLMVIGPKSAVIIGG